MSLLDEKGEAVRDLVRAAMKVDDCETALADAKKALNEAEIEATRSDLLRQHQLVVVEVDGTYYTVVRVRYRDYEYDRATEAVV